MLALGSAVLVAHDAAERPGLGGCWARCWSGIGMGSCNTTYLVSVQAAAALRERGAATASNMFMRIVGQATGAALFGALVNVGIAHYAPQRRRIADRLMEPGLRQALGPAEIGDAERGDGRGVAQYLHVVRRATRARRPVSVTACRRRSARPPCRTRTLARPRTLTATAARRRTAPGSAPTPTPPAWSGRPARLRRRR